MRSSKTIGGARGRLAWMAAAAAAVLAGVAHAQKVDLKADLEPGDTSSWTFDADLFLRATFQQLEQETVEALKYSQDFDTEVLDVADDGSATVELVFTRVTAEYERQGGPEIKDAYDSDDPETPNAMHLKRAIDAVVGAKLRVRVRPSGEVFFVGGLENRAPAADQVAATIFHRMFDTKAIERGLGPMFRLKERLSETAEEGEEEKLSVAAVGAEWLSERAEAARAGAMWTHFTHTLENVEDGVASIRTTGDIIITNADLTPVSPTFKLKEVSGAAQWDAENGGLLSKELEWRVEMEMGGAEMPIVIWITDESKLQRREP